MTALSRALALLALLLPTTALAKPTEAQRRWVDLQVGTHVTLADSARFSEENDRVRLSASASVYLLEDLAVGVRGRFGVPGDPAHSYEVLATASYDFLRIPLAHLFAGAGLGYYWREVWGSDWVFNDDGFCANLETGLRFAFSRWIVPAVVFTYALSHSQHHERNSSYPEWTHGLLAGVTLSVAF
jgi:hypothetical protein